MAAVVTWTLCWEAKTNQGYKRTDTSEDASGRWSIYRSQRIKSAAEPSKVNLILVFNAPSAWYHPWLSENLCFMSSQMFLSVLCMCSITCMWCVVSVWNMQTSLELYKHISLWQITNWTSVYIVHLSPWNCKSVWNACQEFILGCALFDPKMKDLPQCLSGFQFCFDLDTGCFQG